ncbi:MAG: hypothetical protein A3F80_01200 [Candidatus Melainabacteria bacterium RIFCSPLOWO2_12_FULL_35_11]|nr:MAG: hypothetical protein A3F80_01200 [Candidatus Melainabacteria bacterium RIFCSPLOWO2_12_FULL_35_11]
MSNFYKIFLCLLAATVFFMTTFKEARAAKTGKPSSQTLKVVSNKGEAILYGSVLSPKEDEANILLSKTLLLKIRKTGIDNLSVNLTSSLDSTKTYTVPSDAISIQRKGINKKSGKYLVISLFNLSTPSGITISPSSLPTDDYKLKLAGKDIDATTEKFNYQTPVLIVGTVDSKTSGLVTVESLGGDDLSDKTVATDPSGTFFTEVRASKINSTTKARKYLRAQATEGVELPDTDDGVVEEINTGVVHCVTDTDLYAVTPLDNNPDTNAARANKPLEVNEETTLTANLAIQSAEAGDEDLAFGIAENELEDLTGEEEEEEGFAGPPGDIGCNIDQFADRCKGANEDILASIGAEFKKFVVTANCNFPEFRLIKKIIPKLPDIANVFIGKGYCEHATRETDDRRPCEIYAGILRDFKTGRPGGELVCPPYQCEEFKNIRPPRCVEPHDFCDKEFEDDFDGPVFSIAKPMPPPPPGRCIDRPMKDLFCAEIGKDIKAEECKDDGFGPPNLRPNWMIYGTNGGKEYCVPTNIPPPPPPPPGVIDWRPPPSTPEQIANEECFLGSCHKGCEKNFDPPSPYPKPIFTPATGSEGHFSPPKCEVCDCHRGCDAEAGRLIECNDKDQYFSKKCCKGRPGPVIFFQTLQEQSFPGGGFGPGRGPVGVNVYDCLCKDTVNNFNEKGYVKPEAQKICLESCPPGYEKNANSDQCLPICDKEKGFVRDPGGICRKKCPEGSFDDGGGYCRCPEGQFIGKSGKCESNTCPQYCYNYPLFRKLLASHDFTGTGTGYTPPSTGPGYIPPGSTGSTNSLPPECQRCSGPPNTTCSSNMRPNPNNNGEAQCICPDSQPYWYQPSGGTGSCVATCPNGNPLPASYANYPPKSPIPCNSDVSQNCPAPYVTNPGGAPPCKCPDATPYNLNTNTGSTCVASCPAELIADYPSGGSASYPANTMKACLCSDRSYPDQNGRCYSGTGYCSPGITVGTNGCTCNPGGGAYNVNGYCTCPANNGPYTKETGCASSSQCPTATPYKCLNGTCVISAASCTSITNCPAPYVINPSGTPPCKCPDATPISYNATCVASCPSPLVPSTPSGSASGMPSSCLCPGTLQYPGANGQCDTTNYCSPGIFPTASNSCTCNPAGGSYFNSNGYCTCPANSGPYTKETGCAASTTQCPAPFVPNPGGTPPCKCPDATPISYNATCVASCPSPLVPTTEPASGQRVCKCSNGSYPDAQGGCGRTCAVGEAPTAASPCTCAGNATFNAQNICSCQAGQTYTTTGCTASITCTLPKVLDPVTSTCICPAGQIQDPANPNNCITQVTCTLPKVLDPATSTCICPAGQVQDPNNSNNCVTQVSCTYPKVPDTATNTCQCPTGRSPDSVIGCTCPSGQVDDSTACVAGQFTLSSAVKNGSNVAFTFSKNFSQICFSVKDSTGNQPGSFCQASGAPISASVLGSLAVGSQVKLCSTNWTNVCSDFVTITGQ